MKESSSSLSIADATMNWKRREMRDKRHSKSNRSIKKIGEDVSKQQKRKQIIQKDICGEGRDVSVSI